MATLSLPPKVWFVTGCSSGFGREIAIAARKRGDFVIATARNLETPSGLKALGCDILALDVTSTDEAVNAVVAQPHAIYNRLDVLVNNAGFVAGGAIEEASSKDIQDIFETNVFGLLRVTRAVLTDMETNVAIPHHAGSPHWFLYRCGPHRLSSCLDSTAIVPAMIIDTPTLNLCFSSTVWNFTNLKTDLDSSSSSQSACFVNDVGFRRSYWSNLRFSKLSRQMDLREVETDGTKGLGHVYFAVIYRLFHH